MIRVLLGLLMLEALLAGALGLVAWGSGLLLQDQWRTEALAAEGDLSRCERQRAAERRRGSKEGR